MPKKCSKCKRKSVYNKELKAPEPASDESVEFAEPVATEEWDSSVMDPEPIPEEGAASEEWESSPSACEELKEPELIPEEDVEPAVAEELEADMPTARGPGICEYYQPDSSPYAGLGVTILIGRQENEYIVPLNIASQFPSLQRSRDKEDSRTMRFPEVDEDIGHTFIHFLYTGDYQTLKPSSTRDMPMRAIEYSRSVLAYHAGLRYGLDGLADHGRKYIQIFDRDVQIFDILAVGRKYFPRITENPWFSEYLTSKIMAIFETNEEIFQQEEFYKGFGEAPDFDKFLGKVMAKAYTHKISSVRDVLGWKSMDNRSTMAVTMNEVSAANNYDSANSALESRNEHFSHAPELAPSTDRDAWLKWEEDGYTEVGSSRVSLLTPCSSSGELSERVCPNWQRHSTHDNLWKSCPKCKSYILNMFAVLILNRE
ncbi:hypothetical protein BJX70DRAFT_22716 [Aspergillus crustosus]